MTRKKYTLHFNIGDQTIPVNFDVFIGGSKASEVPVTTAWTKTFTGTMTIMSVSNIDTTFWEGRHEINFGSPAKHYLVKKPIILTDDPHWTVTDILNDKKEITGVLLEYRNATEPSNKTVQIQVNATMDPDYSSVWDRLVYLKNKFGV